MLLSFNDRYAINVSQILMTHLAQHGIENADHKLTIDYDQLMQDVINNTTFVIFNWTDAVKNELVNFAFTNKVDNPANIVGTGNFVYTKRLSDGSIDASAGEDWANQIKENDSLRRQNHIITMDSSADEIMRSLIFAPDQDMQQRIDVNSISTWIKYIQEQIYREFAHHSASIAANFDNESKFGLAMSAYSQLPAEQQQDNLMNLKQKIAENRFNDLTDIQRYIFDTQSFNNVILQGPGKGLYAYPAGDIFPPK
ncbi:hypothetical protein [Paucilactobacillus suebicus]|uniref:Uncharacterized protein n=2 Tax=Paucilactobacillus suebicus TaxID=152335 RepID=A0A0R1W400_9LACO|nr:hypothetical protein [Paucilactobacillus suebicus]KRM12261.1 hypothetical protein FD16_GL002446 [Paucilactobacillus suebicus DSM 5007 = KCTC 3549]